MSSAPSSLDLSTLVGVDGSVAKAQIEADSAYTGVTVHIVPDGSMVTMDYREDRIRLLVDPSNNIVRPPRKG